MVLVLLLFCNVGDGAYYYLPRLLSNFSLYWRMLRCNFSLRKLTGSFDVFFLGEKCPPKEAVYWCLFSSTSESPLLSSTYRKPSSYSGVITGFVYRIYYCGSASAASVFGMASSFSLFDTLMKLPFSRDFLTTFLRTQTLFLFGKFISFSSSRSRLS